MARLKTDIRPGFSLTGGLLTGGLLAGGLVLCVMLVSLSLPVRAAEQRYRLTIHDEQQQVADFTVELVQTAEEMRQGLMFRMSLPRDAGMFFVLGTPRIAKFWMRNTFIPLDMVFIMPDGRIDSITTRRDTLSEAQSQSKKPVAFVLEINAGLADELGIKPGHRVVLGAAAETR